MRMAFYKGRKRLFNRLVSWWTRGPYSHVELVLDDGLSVSSSFMDGGVRYKRIAFDDAHWDFIELGPQPSGIADVIYEWYGRKYDWRGLVGFVFRRVGDDRKKMFCSEFAMFLIGYKESWRLDPNTSYAVLSSRVDHEKSR